MPTLSELQQQSNDAEHQAFQRAYDALLNVAKDPITCRHFWDVGFTAGQADANDMLTVAHMDGYSKGRDAMRAELARQEAVAWHWTYGGKYEPSELGGFTGWDGPGPDADVEALGASRGRAVRRLYAHPTPPPDVRELVEALREGRRAIGEHSAPHDCYATGPLTGDEFIDLVQCPACCFIAKHDAALAKFGGGI